MGIALPSGSEDPPEGRGTYRQSSAVAENGIFRLTEERQFGDDLDANQRFIPGFAGHEARPMWRAFVFLVLGFSVLWPRLPAGSGLCA
jgi:hypothetical protein